MAVDLRRDALHTMAVGLIGVPYLGTEKEIAGHVLPRRLQGGSERGLEMKDFGL